MAGRAGGQDEVNLRRDWLRSQDGAILLARDCSLPARHYVREIRLGP